jgi:hypothetical protein
MANSYGSITALTAFNSAINNSYTSLGSIDFGAAPPHECFIEIVGTAGSTPSSANQQLVLFVVDSIDGTNFSDTPTSTTEAAAQFLGSLKLLDTSSHRSKAFPVSPLFGGALPQKITVYVKNDTGVTLSASNNTAQYRTETFG